ncbi:MAG TPA: CooT family nickel-binding protein [Methanothrix sp.]|nr:CooT family nickel-binding protein [Methanothrix sp.]HPT37071.1 CooT family nickel-binding protein [Methanothrix sp.]
MCELTVYILKGQTREKAMDGVIRLLVRDGSVLLEGIFGDCMKVEGRLAQVDIMSQMAEIVAN